MQIDALSRRLIDRFQHGMPLCAEPYRAMAEALGCSEGEVLACLQCLEHNGGLSRIGPVFEHSRAGASTLVALAVPERRLEAVAEQINRLPEVNHNYLREHTYNLWFVLTGPDRAHIDALLRTIAAQTGLKPLDLPMRAAYRIDLGFPIGEAS
ncbi:Lrp/AsnC family transcriptional regulator [Pseudomonas sp. PS1]|uniref:siroheme decarboxylase n=1 Tax=Stutzerimonas marianensis TaxID=2929513 RepID=A0A9X1W639_9GAMM|nr:Lrp/AsnC family transcriptional regulator [Pseudomonas marianensis]MCJ0973794.1 Lrp/AsnC family transcriptional regulator [Pseudomonas marianensis]